MNTLYNSLLTIWHDYYLLLIHWKQIIIKVFITFVFTLSELKRRRKTRGWHECLGVGEVEEVEEVERRRQERHAHLV